MSDTKKTDKTVAPAPTSRRKLEDRRRFIRSAVLLTGVVSASMLGFIPVLRAGERRLRPPGAITEHEFLAACIKCGQCLQVCPVEAIRLGDLQDGFGLGVPHIDSRDQACDFSCDGLQCVLACPTGALTHNIDYPHQARMGIARLVRPNLCLARNGLGLKGLARGANFDGKLRFEKIDRWKPIELKEHPFDLEICDLCVRQCPIEIRAAECAAGHAPSGDPNQCPPKRAISMVAMESADGVKRMTPVVHEGCVGCGVCEMVCPTGEPAIVVEPRETWSAA